MKKNTFLPTMFNMNDKFSGYKNIKYKTKKTKVFIK